MSVEMLEPEPVPQEGRVPSCADRVFWDTFSKPVLEFLSEWRTWAEISDKFPGTKQETELYHHAVAYLRLNGKIKYHHLTDSWGPPSVMRPPMAEVKRVLEKNYKSRKNIPKR